MTLQKLLLLSVAAAAVSIGSCSGDKSPSVTEQGVNARAAEDQYVAASIDGTRSTDHATAPENYQTAKDPEILPIYVNADGVGILRYSRPDGSERELWLAAGGMTDNPERPFETIASDAGPFAGPHIAIYLPGGKMHLPLDQIVFALSERGPYKHIAYLRPVIDPAKAETIEACGEVSRSYECSKTGP